MGTVTNRDGTTVAPPNVVCQQDYVKQYDQYNPKITRKGINLHGTVNITPDIQAYAMANWYNTQTESQLTPLNFTGTTAAGGTTVPVSRIFLPAYVCSAATPVFTGTSVSFAGCDATNGTLNPSNPFASQGLMARLSERWNQPRTTLTDANTYRLSGGVSGTFSGFNFNVEATSSRVDLDVTQENDIFLKNLLYAIGTGKYNFADPSQNTAAQNEFIAPTSHNHSTSKLTQIQGTIGKDLLALPGGNLNLAVGASWRQESLNNPSANPANEVDPTARYYNINAVGAIGSRNVWAGYYSLDVPAFEGFDFKAEGRYDKYSSGQKAFSPKFEAQYRPIREIKLRGTWSRGFRVPSFNEAYGLPTTGYISSTINCTTYAAFCASHPVATYYSGGYSYGLTSVGNPGLAPEKSSSWTAGTVIEPNRFLTMTVDFWHTKIKNIIIPATSPSSLISQYYLNNGVVTAPPGVSLIPGTPDPNAPNALPLLGFVQASYTNADSEVASGVDLSATARVPLNHSGLRLISSLSASYLGKLTLSDPQNGVQAYAGTLGPCNITSCSGAPRWRGSWQNTLDFGGRASLTATTYYTSGYSEISTDTGGILGDCIGSAEAGSMSQTYYDGSPILCRAKATWDVDLTGQIKLLNHFTLYGNVLNVLGTKPPYDPNAAYGTYQFNPAWADKNFIGRYYRVGLRVDF
jgi:iron complex outermembrane receptor protein